MRTGTKAFPSTPADMKGNMDATLPYVHSDVQPRDSMDRAVKRRRKCVYLFVGMSVSAVVVVVVILMVFLVFAPMQNGKSSGGLAVPTSSSGSAAYDGSGYPIDGSSAGGEPSSGSGKEGSVSTETTTTSNGIASSPAVGGSSTSGKPEKSSGGGGDIAAVSASVHQSSNGEGVKALKEDSHKDESSSKTEDEEKSSSKENSEEKKESKSKEEDAGTSPAPGDNKNPAPAPTKAPTKDKIHNSPTNSPADYKFNYDIDMNEFPNSNLTSDYGDNNIKAMDEEEGAVTSITATSSDKDGARIRTKYRLKGSFKVSAEIKAASAANGGSTDGIVTTFYTSSLEGSKDKNEIDFEFLGKNPRTVQTNVFLNGVGKKEMIHQLDFDPREDIRTYTIEVRGSTITWSVSDVSGNPKAIRTETIEGINDKGQVAYLSLWDGSVVSPDWSGKTDWKNGPYTAKYRSLSIAMDDKSPY